MNHDFRMQPFDGTLYELLEAVWPEMPAVDVHLRAHDWLRGQLGVADNLLPVRKFSPHRERGAIHAVGARAFMPADNEPLAALYRRWVDGVVAAESIGELLRRKAIPASWKCDVLGKGGLRFSGVSAPFRDRGLKLAHIHDAAAGLGVADDAAAMQTRFIRSLSPLNVFLFPSVRVATTSLVGAPEGWRPTHADWAEDPWVRGVALGFLSERLGAGATALLACDEFQSEVKPNPAWERLARATHIHVEPRRSRRSAQSPVARAAVAQPPSGASQAQGQAAACPHVPKSRALSVADAVEVLRTWRAEHPEATQLNGRTGNDPARWFHITVDGYRSPLDDFKSQHGKTFRGDDYNGVVNFHGDTKVEAIDRFIALIDEAEDYHDVLRPSATYEKKSLPTKRSVRPKFALQGHQEAVDGFFLYHDGWVEA